MRETERVAHLDIRLKGFEQPDTGSQLEGFLEPGTYAVEAVIEGSGPGGDADYARVLAPSLGAGDTWICTRWKDQRYARIEEVAAPPAATTDAAGDPRAIPEAALIGRLEPFHGFTYDLDEARYPFALDGVSLPLAPPATNNCCTFVEGLVVKAWQDVHGADARWSAERHRQMMIMSADDFFSPVTAAVEAGLGVATPESAAPAPWTLIQGWRHQWRGGHTFLIAAHHAGSDRVLTLESNSAFGLDGVGYRKIGNLRDHPKPPQGWWERDDLWTWKQVRAVYRFRRCAALKVTGCSWSGLP